LAGKFYEELFGWQIEYQGRYAVVRHGGKRIAGILQVDPADGRTREGVWIPSVSVADVDAAASLVQANGGKILKGPIDMDKRGRAVLIRDSQRANLVLLSAKGGDPADAEAAIGDWLWDEVWTNDPDNTGAFYRSVLGYDEMVLGDEYQVFVHKGEWRAGIRHVRDDKEYMLWVPVVRVADPVATAQRVSELGGVVWVAPDEAPSNGDTALIGDATGALLTMKQSIRPFVILLALSGVLLLTGCSGSGGGHSSVHYGVYSGYGYPYYGSGGNNYYYYNNRPNRPNRPDRPDRPDRPNRPERPTTLPAQRPGGGMGRPAMSRGGGGFGGGGRGGGGRGRR